MTCSDSIPIASPIWPAWQHVADLREHAALWFCLMPTRWDDKRFCSNTNSLIIPLRKHQ